MTFPKNWILLFTLTAAVTAVALLFSLELAVVAGSPGQKAGHASILRREMATVAQDSEEFTASGMYTTYLPLVALNAGAPPPLFGVQMYGAVTYTTGLAQVAGMGARWIRAPISWASAEPVNCTPDQYDWTAIDAQVQALASEGIEPLLTLSGNPTWAATYPMGPVTDLADLQEFMGALVERFDGDGYEDAPGSPPVRYWEIYNEPDAIDESAAATGGYALFGYNGAGYAELLDAIYPVVKAASSQAQIVLGGVAHDNFDYEGGGFDDNFMDDVLSNCTTPCFDVMNFHYFPYYRFRWEAYGRDVIGKANYFRSKLAGHGFDRSLMCTETTWPAASTWGSQALQSRYAAIAYVRGMAAGLVVQNWYAWRDVDSSLPGLLDNELQPKPAYYAYQAMTTQLGQARYVRPLSKEEKSSGAGKGLGFMFNRNESNQFQGNVIILDECSMLDTRLMAAVLRAVGPGCRVVLVGDQHQLPPIGDGEPFKDLVNSGRIYTTELTKIMRTNPGQLLSNVTRIREKKQDEIQFKKHATWEFIEIEDDDELTRQTIVEIASDIFKKSEYDPYSFQIITPRKKGHPLCVYELNKMFKDINFPHENTRFARGEKGICTGRSDHHDLLNGDIFVVTQVLPRKGGEAQKMVVAPEIVPTGFSPTMQVHLSDRSLETGWAITVHKYQGCEADLVIFVITDSMGSFPNRNMLYTALTRAKTKVIIVGSKTAFLRSLGAEEVTRGTGFSYGLRQIATHPEHTDAQMPVPAYDSDDEEL